MKKTVDYYNNTLDVFETNFDATAKTLYDLETKHITKMGTFLKTIQKAQVSTVRVRCLCKFTEK